MTAASSLVDGFGRRHNNLRISVTDRCNIRCFYCMPATDVTFLPHGQLLTFEEIEKFVRVAAPLGITKLRLTGGEPLVRRELWKLVAALAVVPGIHDIGLTTNGILLAEQAEALYAAGLRRINISLDTLDAVRFREITRRDGFEKVLEGIAAAIHVGFRPIKINAVAIRGMTEADVAPLCRFVRDHDIEIRFIEYMPLDAENRWERDKVLRGREIVEIVEREVGALVPRGRPDPNAPASEFQFADGRGRLGLIASVSEPFCEHCNRLRLTAEGKLRACLFSLDETDVRSLLRGGDSEAAIAQAIQRCVAGKWEGHEINTARFLKPERPMHAIGG